MANVNPWLIVMYDTKNECIAQTQMLLCQQQVNQRLQYLKEQRSTKNQETEWYDNLENELERMEFDENVK